MCYLKTLNNDEIIVENEKNINNFFLSEITHYGQRKKYHYRNKMFSD